MTFTNYFWHRDTLFNSVDGGNDITHKNGKQNMCIRANAESGQ